MANNIFFWLPVTTCCFLITGVNGITNLASLPGVTCLTNDVTSDSPCAELTDGDVSTRWTWGLVNETVSYLDRWLMITLPDMAYVEAVSLPGLPQQYLQLEFIFSDGRNIQLTTSTSQSEVNFSPVLTRSVLMRVTGFDRNGSVYPDVYGIPELEISGTLEETRIVGVGCELGGQDCKYLTDGVYDSTYIVRLHKNLTLTFPNETWIECVGFLEAVEAGFHAQYDAVRMRVETDDSDEYLTTHLCERAMTSGVTWQHICFPDPFRATSLTLTPLSLHSAAIVNGFREIEVYTLGRMFHAARTSQNAPPTNSCQPMVEGQSPLPPLQEISLTTTTAPAAGQTSTLWSNGASGSPQPFGGMTTAANSSHCDSDHLWVIIIAVSSAAAVCMLGFIITSVILCRIAYCGQNYPSVDDFKNGEKKFSNLERESHIYSSGTISKRGQSQWYDVISDITNNPTNQNFYEVPATCSGENEANEDYEIARDNDGPM